MTLEDASFEECLELVAKLNIEVYPWEDLKSRRINCGMNVRDIQKTEEQDWFAKVVLVGRAGLEPVTP
jgi:hypothetical protein